MTEGHDTSGAAGDAAGSRPGRDAARDRRGPRRGAAPAAARDVAGPPPGRAAAPGRRGGRRGASPAAVRRRRRLGAAAAAAFAAGVLVAAVTSGDPGRRGSGPGAPAAERDDVRAAPAAAADPAPVDDLTLEQQVGQTLVLRFAGTTAPGYVRRALRARRAAGAILFRDNVVAPAQLRALTRGLRAAGEDPIVAVDQEGGEIRILPWAPPAASAPQQAAAGTVRADARAAARALRAAGVTVSLAPVVDVTSVSGAALAGRSFDDDPQAVARAARESVAGWRAGGVAATAKHFPGLGAAQVNTDDAPATVVRTPARLAAIDLVPFRAAVDAGVPLVMIGHARYPTVDARRIASQSPAVVRLLRERLAFRGVIVTDSMEAAASLATGTVEVASERALRAGADLLLLTGRGSYTPVLRHLTSAARRSPALRARVREAAARVLALRQPPPRPPR